MKLAKPPVRAAATKSIEHAHAGHEGARNLNLLHAADPAVAACIQNAHRFGLRPSSQSVEEVVLIARR